jgi:phosphoadenosine phosphosulfate reductase
VLERSDDGRVKVNPLAHWSHGAVWAHLKTHRVPYNPLHDRGYASVGDVGTTEPTPEGGGERAGRFTHR